MVSSEPHDVAILDDGFQHLRLRRNLDLVAIDATQPFGYGHCLPRGLLREPASALRRADAVVITRSDQAPPEALAAIERTVRRYLPPGAPVLRAVHRPTQLLRADGEAAPLEAVRGRACYLFCGLGNPEAFRRTVEDLGAIVVGSRDFADHHPYTAADVDAVAEAARAVGAEWILTTTKDFAKAADNDLGPLWPDTAHTAAVEIELTLADGDHALDELLRPLVGVAQQGDTSREEP
jgi:tetraacyldisaccharide 4'-kinase